MSIYIELALNEDMITPNTPDEFDSLVYWAIVNDVQKNKIEEVIVLTQLTCREIDLVDCDWCVDFDVSDRDEAEAVVILLRVMHHVRIFLKERDQK